MKLTNKLGLPEPFVLACQQDDYDAGASWRTVTELIGPPKVAALKHKYRNQIEEDVLDRVYTLQGQIVHGLVEKMAKEMSKEGWSSERRIFAQIRGRLISGQFDLYHPKSFELVDLKNSTAWKGKKGECTKEWEDQLNCLAALLRLEGNRVESAKILLVIRDHSKLEAKRDPAYPQTPVLYLKANLWTNEDALHFLEERVRLHESAEKQEVPCSPEERWAKPDIWAIKKKGYAKAIPGGLYARKEAAELALRPGQEIEYRPGENTRCNYYCNVNRWCSQFMGGK